LCYIACNCLLLLLRVLRPLLLCVLWTCTSAAAIAGAAGNNVLQAIWLQCPRQHNGCYGQPLCLQLPTAGTCTATGDNTPGLVSFRIEQNKQPVLQCPR
jgi:hypothetical protein